MDPDFQRDFIWPEDKQSKLIESVLMRVPLPVFYMAEDNKGRMIVVDGLQRLSTVQRFLDNRLRLRLPGRREIDGKTFDMLSAKLRNRIEDCNLVFYIIDSKADERVLLDIFERDNGGEPLTKQQMRNCLCMGQATRFLKDESKTSVFLKATGNSLNTKTMRDREFVNRFCAFLILDLDEYRGNMDIFLAKCLRKMNTMPETDMAQLGHVFRRSLEANYKLFGRHAFRKHEPGQDWRAVINASLWDVMSTGLSRYSAEIIDSRKVEIRNGFYDLLDNEEFNASITISTNDTKRVNCRFRISRQMFREILG